MFYFRYTVNGKQKSISIGPFKYKDQAGKYTLEQARLISNSYSDLHRDPKSRDVSAYLQQAEADRLEAIRKAEEAAELERVSQTNDLRYTLKALCEQYVSHLKAAKAASARNVECQLKLYVHECEWALLPAKNFTARQATALLRKIIESGKGHTAKKIRSFLHSAYAMALRSETDAVVPADMLAFDIEVNPIASTSALSKFNTARTRNLSPSEMGELWRRLCAPDQEQTAALRALRLTILLGGQRGQQLLRVRRVEDVDMEGMTITLYDPKGKRKAPRPHMLPIVGKAVEDIVALIERSEKLESKWLFQGAKEQMGPETLSDQVHDLSVSFNESGISKQPFQFSDLRRTAETLMAGMRIHKDIRAQLQSHGLSGVQDRHYDMYEYMDEKKAAITAWQDYLDLQASGKPMASNVVELKQA